MKSYFKHLKPYLWIQRKRFKEKFRIYSLTLQVIGDRTTIIYSLVLFVYAILGFFIVSDFFTDYKQFMIRLEIEELAWANLHIIFMLLPLLYVFRSFRNPGVTYTSSEYMLTMLPYDRKKFFYLILLKHWVGKLLLFVSIGLVVGLLTPFSMTIIFSYTGVILGSDLLFRLFQWRLFQKTIWIKILVLFLFLVIEGLQVLLSINLSLFISVIIFAMVGINIYILRKTLFQGVDWHRVIALGDYHVWHMPLISYLSKAEMKRPKGLSIFQQLPSRRRPFLYNDSDLYHRLWQIYFGRNIKLVIQSMGALSIITLLFLFFDLWLFSLVLALAIYVYGVIMKRFFESRFTTDIVHMLPWDFKNYQKTFLQWAFAGGFIFLFPAIFVAMKQSPFLGALQLVFYGSTFVCVVMNEIDHTISILKNEIFLEYKQRSIAYLALCTLFLSAFTPYLFLLGLVFPFYLRKKWNEI